MNKILITTLDSIDCFHPFGGKILVKLSAKEAEGSILMHPNWQHECDNGLIVKVGDESILKAGVKVAYRQGAGDLIQFKDQSKTYFVLIDPEDVWAIVED